MAEARPRVSCVMTVLDGARHIAAAIDSVRAQGMADWELLIVDDGSTDATLDIVADYVRRDPRIRLLRHPHGGNEGKSISRNLGVAASHAPLIAMLDADDLWLPGKLDRQLAVLDAEPEVDLIFGPVVYHYAWTGRVGDFDRDSVARVTLPTDRPVAPPEALVAMLHAEAGRHESQWPYPSATIFRRSLFDRAGGFEADFPRLYDDTIFFAKALAIGTAWAESTPEALYRLHPGEAMSTSYEEAARSGVDARHLAERHFAERLEERLLTLTKMRGPLRRAVWRNTLRFTHPGLLLALERLGRLRRLLRERMRASNKKGGGRPPRPGAVDWGDFGRICFPAHATHGRGGSVVDRRFDAWIKRFESDLRGDAAEIGDDVLLRRHGAAVVSRTVIPGESHVASQRFDAVIAADALRAAPSPQAALNGLEAMLRPGGVLLASLPALARPIEGATDYWRFTEASVRLLFADTGNLEITHLDAVGPMAETVAALFGLGIKDLPETPDSPLYAASTVLVRALKRADGVS